MKCNVPIFISRALAVILAAILITACYSGIKMFSSSLYGKALMELNHKHYENAKQRFEFLAMFGHAPSQTMLAEIHAYGWGVPHDRDKAIKWFKRSVSEDRPHLIDPTAQFAYYVGMAFAKGKRTKQDQAEADWWFNFAKERGYTRGNIGNILNISPIFVAGDIAREDYKNHLSEQTDDADIFAYFQEIKNYRITLKEEKEYYFIGFDLVGDDQKTLHDSWAKYRVNKNDLTIAERIFLK